MDIHEYCQQHLTHYKAPKHIEIAGDQGALVSRRR